MIVAPIAQAIGSSGRADCWRTLGGGEGTKKQAIPQSIMTLGSLVGSMPLFIARLGQPTGPKPRWICAGKHPFDGDYFSAVSWLSTFNFKSLNWTFIAGPVCNCRANTPEVSASLLC